MATKEQVLKRAEPTKAAVPRRAGSAPPARGDDATKSAAADPGRVDTGVAAVGVARDGQPSLLLTIARTETLSKVRELLFARGVMPPSDLFTDAKGFPIAIDEEGDWTLAKVFGRSGTETLNLRSTAGRLPQEETRGTPEAAPLEAPSLPELPDDLRAEPPALPRTELEMRRIELPLHGVEVGDAITDPVHLGRREWSDLIERTHLTHGLRLDLPSPRPSFVPAFDIVGGIPRFIVWDESGVTATVTHSERETAMVESKFAKASASASYSFVAASFEGSYRSRTSTSTAAQRTTITGSWNYPRIVVRLAPEDLVPTPALKAAVECALASPGEEARFYALCAVFENFGQVWATEVTLGGQLLLSDKASLAGVAQEAEAEAAMRAAVSAKAGLFKGDAKAAMGTSTASASTLLDQFRAKSLTAVGGDTRLVEDAAKWAPTVGPVANWRVIGRDGLRPVYELLDAELRGRVVAVLETVDPRYIPATFDAGEAEGMPAEDVRRAERDGLLVARLVGTTAVAAAASGPQGMPGAPVVAATSWEGLPPPKGGTRRARWQTLTLPVRRGDSYLVDRVEGTMPPAPVRFIEFVDVGQAVLAPRVVVGSTREGPVHWEAPSCGLLLASAQVSMDVSAPAPLPLGDRTNTPVVFGGQVTVRRGGDGEDLGRVTVTALERRGTALVPQASMCLPVLAGSRYDIVATPPPELSARVGIGSLHVSGEVWAEVSFVPIDGVAARIDPPLERSDDVYQAECDGLLVCWSQAGTFTTVEVLAGADRTTFQKGEPVGALSTGLSGPDWPDAATTTVPIRRGHYYCVRTSGAPQPGRVMFFPLRRF